MSTMLTKIEKLIMKEHSDLLARIKTRLSEKMLADELESYLETEFEAEFVLSKLKGDTKRSATTDTLKPKKVNPFNIFKKITNGKLKDSEPTFNSKDRTQRCKEMWEALSAEEKSEWKAYAQADANPESGRLETESEIESEVVIPHKEKESKKKAESEVVTSPKKKENKKKYSMSKYVSKPSSMTPPPKRESDSSDSEF